MAVGRFGTALDAITWSSIDTANDMLTVCDANGDDLGTGPEDKRIAMVELIKRTIASSDVSWMTALGLSSADASNDKWLIWDASTTSFKTMTASDLLDKTYAGTSVSGVTTLANLAAVDPTADYLLVWDNSASAWKKLLSSALINKLLPSTTTDYTSTPTAVSASLTGQRLTNYGATQVVTFTLPAATVGLRYSFTRRAGYAVRIDPNGTETIDEGGAGKYLSIEYRGQVDIECLTSGEWEVTGGSGLYVMEP